MALTFFKSRIQKLRGFKRSRSGSPHLPSPSSTFSSLATQPTPAQTRTARPPSSTISLSLPASASSHRVFIPPTDLASSFVSSYSLAPLPVSTQTIPTIILPDDLFSQHLTTPLTPPPRYFAAAPPPPPLDLRPFLDSSSQTATLQAPDIIPSASSTTSATLQIYPFSLPSTILENIDYELPSVSELDLAHLSVKVKFDPSLGLEIIQKLIEDNLSRPPIDESVVFNASSAGWHGVEPSNLSLSEKHIMATFQAIGTKVRNRKGVISFALKLEVGLPATTQQQEQQARDMFKIDNGTWDIFIGVKYIRLVALNSRVHDTKVHQNLLQTDPLELLLDFLTHWQLYQQHILLG